MVEGINGMGGIGGMPPPKPHPADFSDLQQKIRETEALIEEYKKPGHRGPALLEQIKYDVMDLSSIINNQSLNIPQNKRTAFDNLKGNMEANHLLNDPTGDNIVSFITKLASGDPTTTTNYNDLKDFMDDVSGN